MLFAQVVSQGIGGGEALFTDVTAVGGSSSVHVLVQLLVFLQLKALIEGLPAHLAHRANLTGMLPHVIQQILLFAKDIAACVTFVLNPTGVDWDVLLETVEPRELPGTDGATEEAAVVLLRVSSVVYLRNLVYQTGYISIQPGSS